MDSKGNGPKVPAEADASAERRGRAGLWLLSIVTIVLVGWALRAVASIAVPVVFSMFLALLVAPVDNRVRQAVPDRVGWLGHIAAMGTILFVLFVFIGCLWIAAQQVIQRFPDGSGSGTSLLPDLGGELLSGSGASGDTAGGGDAAGEGDGSQGPDPLAEIGGMFTGAGSDLGDRVADWASGFAAGVISTAGNTLAAAVLVFFLTLLMLIEAPAWRRKSATAMSAPARDNTSDSVQVIAERLRRYLLTRTVLGIATGVLYAGWLWLFDVDLLIVWGLLAFLLNFIPTLGSLVAGILPVIYAFAQKDSGTALLIGAGLLLIEQVMGNYVDPRVQGKQVSLSPLVVLVTLLVWGWIWGVVGAILAVPITITAMIVLAHVEPMRPLALFLSDETDMEGLDRMSQPD